MNSSDIVAAAIGKFSICEYGKLNRRELQRIQDVLSTNAVEMSAAEVKRAAWSSVNDRWVDVLAPLTEDQKSLCFAGAENVASGSGRKQIPAELRQRMLLLFDHCGVSDDLDKTYQMILAERERAALDDIMKNGPVYMRVAQWRVSTTEEPEGFDCSAIPGYTGRQRTITVYRFDSRSEYPISVKNIRGAVDLRTGEICDAAAFIIKI